MQYILIPEENNQTGELGFRDSRIPKHSDIYGAITGYELAHDILEHTAFNNVADEIEALGAVYYIRLTTGYVNQYGRNITVDDLAFDWYSLHSAIPNSNLPELKRTTKLDSSIEEDLTNIISEGHNYMLKEIKAMSMDNSDLRDDQIQDLELLTRNFAHYFRRGYRKAVRRFKGHKVHDIGHLYSKLGERLAKYNAEDLIPLVVTINKDLSFNITEQYESDDSSTFLQRI